MGIGLRIKEAREKKGLTQKELGKLVGVTASAITNYENETSHPKEPVLYALLNNLGVDANYLFQDEMRSYESKVKKTTDPARESLLHSYDKLNPAGQEKVVTYAADLVDSGKYRNDAIIYRAARSEQHTEHGVESHDDAAMNRLANAPKVISEKDLK